MTGQTIKLTIPPGCCPKCVTCCRSDGGSGCCYSSDATARLIKYATTFTYFEDSNCGGTPYATSRTITQLGPSTRIGCGVWCIPARIDATDSNGSSTTTYQFIAIGAGGTQVATWGYQTSAAGSSDGDDDQDQDNDTRRTGYPDQASLLAAPCPGFDGNSYGQLDYFDAGNDDSVYPDSSAKPVTTCNSFAQTYDGSCLDSGDGNSYAYQIDIEVAVDSNHCCYDKVANGCASFADNAGISPGPDGTCQYSNASSGSSASSSGATSDGDAP